MLADVDLALVADFAGVSDVRQQAVEAGAVEGPAAALAALARLPALAHPAAASQLLHHRQERLVLQVELEDGADAGGLFLVDQQSPAPRVHVVAEDGPAARPLAFTARGSDLVTRALADDLPF